MIPMYDVGYYPPRFLVGFALGTFGVGFDVVGDLVVGRCVGARVGLGVENVSRNGIVCNSMWSDPEEIEGWGLSPRVPNPYSAATLRPSTSAGDGRTSKYVQ